MDLRDCKKCLPAGLSDTEYNKSVSGYIANISEELKTPEETYAYRLDHCKRCKYIINGLCRLCGCFVEIRAASVKSYCPNKIAFW